MKNKKIILAGGSGFMGAGLANYFGEENDIVILTRHSNNTNNAFGYTATPGKRVSYVHWDGQTLTGWEKALEGADLLINLAGKSVNCRYTEANKKAIIDSRIAPTLALARAVQGLQQPPSLWINAASATIYRDARDKPQDEFTGELGNSFSEEVCKTWEGTFNALQLPATRKALLRTAIALGPGNALIPLLNLVKFGLGGPQGDGQQLVSWVHMTDICRMVDWLYENPLLSGAFNCSAPHPVTNQEFMRMLRKATGHLFGLPSPALLLQMGAILIGTETELILKSRWVLPARALQAGFSFHYPDLLPALQQIVSQLPRRRYHLV